MNIHPSHLMVGHTDEHGQPDTPHCAHCFAEDAATLAQPCPPRRSINENPPSGADPLPMASVENADDYVKRTNAEREYRKKREDVAELHGCINLLIAKALKYGRATTPEAQEEATKQLQAVAVELTSRIPF